MIDAVNSDFALNSEQKKAVKLLERAFAKCLKANIFFHNHYGKLIAFDGNIVENVDDKKTATQCTTGELVNIKEKIDSWADDWHYVHFKK